MDFQESLPFNDYKSLVDKFRSKCLLISYIKRMWPVFTLFSQKLDLNQDLLEGEDHFRFVVKSINIIALFWRILT